MSSKSHYDALGVARNAHADVVQAAYRALAKLYHPDVAKGPKDLAAARFRAINDAYEVLSDTRRRAKYDAQLDALTTEPQASSLPPRPAREPPRTVETEPQSHRAAPERKSSSRSRSGENAWLIAGALMVGPIIIPSWLTPFSAHSWPAVQTLISMAIAGVSLLKLRPKFGRDTSLAQTYWRGVGYFMIIIVLMAVIEIIGGL